MVKREKKYIREWVHKKFIFVVVFFSMRKFMVQKEPNIIQSSSYSRNEDWRPFISLLIMRQISHSLWIDC